MRKRRATPTAPAPRGPAGAEPPLHRFSLIGQVVGMGDADEGDRDPGPRLRLELVDGRWLDLPMTVETLTPIAHGGAFGRDVELTITVRIRR